MSRLFTAGSQLELTVEDEYGGDDEKCLAQHIFSFECACSRVQEQTRPSTVQCGNVRGGG